MVPGILEFNIARSAKAVANDSTGVFKARPEPTAECGPHILVEGASRERFKVAAHG
jgi:hypothetical protein